MIIGIIDIR